AAASPPSAPAPPPRSATPGPDPAPGPGPLRPGLATDAGTAAGPDRPRRPSGRPLRHRRSGAAPAHFPGARGGGSAQRLPRRGALPAKPRPDRTTGQPGGGPPLITPGGSLHRPGRNRPLPLPEPAPERRLRALDR